MPNKIFILSNFEPKKNWPKIPIFQQFLANSAMYDLVALKHVRAGLILMLS